MNWIKSKKQRIVIVISTLLILCGFLLIPLSKGAENFPHDMWSNLIFLMTMAGGGGFGAVIGIPIGCRIIERRQNKNQSVPVNRLKRKAWFDFGAVCAGMIAWPLMFGFMTYADIKGAMGAKFFTISLLSTGLGVGFMIFLTKGKQQKQFLPQFDEREFHLIHKAINRGNTIFICYTLFVMIAAFYIIGGRGMVPMWSIPLVLYGGMFIAGTVQFLVLMHHAKEDEKSIEGGTV